MAARPALRQARKKNSLADVERPIHFVSMVAGAVILTVFAVALVAIVFEGSGKDLP